MKFATTGKVLIPAVMSTLMFGCATYEPVEPKDRYPGRIIEKVEKKNPNLKEELREAEVRYRTSLFLFGLGSALGGAIGGSLVGANVDAIGGETISGEPYRYTIEMPDSKKVVILNKHSGFAVGDCVDVLVGKETKQVSMAYGANCDDGS
ncbi:hypothetical protein [Thiosocius teredinicola]|uniref:hypothetical protein n=1 Tax=Thiosocius teredinicola TaxID=1973002 RepID=UPI000F7826DF